MKKLKNKKELEREFMIKNNEKNKIPNIKSHAINFVQ